MSPSLRKVGGLLLRGGWIGLGGLCAWCFWRAPPAQAVAAPEFRPMPETQAAVLAAFERRPARGWSEDPDQEDRLDPPFSPEFAAAFHAAFAAHYGSPEGFAKRLDQERTRFDRARREAAAGNLRQDCSYYAMNRTFVPFSANFEFTDGLSWGYDQGASRVRRQDDYADSYVRKAEQSGVNRVQSLVRPERMLDDPFDYPPEFLIWYALDAMPKPLPAEMAPDVQAARERSLDGWVSIVQELAFIEPSLAAAESELGVRFRRPEHAWRALIPEYDRIFLRMREAEQSYCAELLEVLSRHGLIIVNPLP